MWRRSCKLLYRFAAVSFRDMSVFRTDFLMSLLHNLVYQAIFLIFWKSVLSFTASRLGGWTFPELAVLSSFTLISAAVAQWLVGLLQLSSKILDGDLDKYLCKPVPPLLALLGDSVNGLASFQQLASAGVLLTAVCLYYRVPLSPGSVAAGLLILVLGCAAVLLIRGCIALSAFWLGDVSRINGLFQISSEFERYPVNLFPLWLQGTLTWVVPVGLISTWPVLAFLGKGGPPWAWLGTGAALVAFWGLIFREIWRRALRRYESFGG
jgi:ABC-2 type transport system permease protein